MSRFVDVVPTLKNMLVRNDGSIKNAAKELTYEKRRERFISILDSRRLFEIVDEIKDLSKEEIEERFVLVRDGNSIVTRTSIDIYI